MFRKAAVLLLLLGASPIAAEQGTVIGVIDADTFRVRIGEETKTVRLAGVDAPDPARPHKAAEYYGQEALLYVSRRLTENPKVELVLDPQAGEQRGQAILRDAILEDGTDLAVELVGAGYATVSGNSRRFDELRKLERQAKREKRGLWDATNFASYKKYLVEWETGAHDFGAGPDIGMAYALDFYDGDVYMILILQ